jgi:hypothetical protein
MNQKNSRFVLVSFSFLLLFGIFFSLSVIFAQHGLSSAFASLSDSNATIVDEGNSTYVKPSQVMKQDNNISTVIVIPNPNSNPSSDNISDKSIDGSEAGESSSVSNETENGLEQSKNMQPPAAAAGPKTSQQSNISNNMSSSSSLSFQNETQRGQYLVDNNGVHYYDVNNCSLVKGSSGIGDLSECEDAEREIQEELTG